MRDLNMGTIGALLLFFLSIHFSLSAELDTLDPNTPLTDGETLVSAGGMFVLGFFSPRGSSSRYVGIWYNKVSVQTVVWVANRQHPIAGGSAGTLTISSMNGSLVVGDVSNSSTIVWFTPVNANVSNPIAQLLDDGNLVVREEGNKDPESYAWQSFDHPTDTLLPGMKLGWDLRKGINRNLTSWASESDPSPGTYTVAMDAHQGDPEFFMWSGGRRTWRSGPWNGLWLSGIPEMETYSNQFTFGFVSNADEVYYGYHIRNTTSIVSRFVVIPSGQTQRVVWIEASRAWNPYWFAPKDQCDSYSACGPYGVCSVDRSPICICLQGFDPKSPDKWALRDGTDGCVRRTALDCRNGTDGFVKIAGAKLPDTTAAVVDWSMSLDQCQTECLSNCSCKGYARANVSGSGCIIWTAEITDLRVYMYGEQDLYVRLAAADLDSTSNPHHKRSKATAAVLVISVVMALLIGCIAYRWKKRKQRARGSIPFRDHFHHESVRDSDGELRLFDLLDIIAATEDFSIGNKLGEGGFGPVYKGRMNDGQEIAVKRLAKTSMQGQDEFKNEVMLIAKLQHRNLVRLLGCCIHGDERMLVYEYMYNKSLDASLFGEVKHLTLDWKTRYNIILGVARGLLYLHQDSRLRIIHRDLKASNILLDKEMIPKISDFGIARIFGGDETEVNTRKVVGTYGYMSPEYAMDGVFSVKSDVFSFGVLVLEIVSGKKNRGVYQSKYQQNLLGHAWSLWKDGNGHKLVDDSLACSFSMSEALRCIEVGLLCVQERPEDRPIMLSVVAMLGNDNMPSSPPKQPGFVAARGPIESDSSASKNKSLDMNVLSSSILEGR